MIKTKETMEKVVIEQMEDEKFSLYNEAGQLIEEGFESQAEAKEFAWSVPQNVPKK
jgi:hypothetical protein